MSDFVEVTMARTAPPVNAEMKAILERAEWQKLLLLAEELPVDCVWSAKPVEGQSHRSASA